MDESNLVPGEYKSKASGSSGSSSSSSSSSDSDTSTGEINDKKSKKSKKISKKQAQRQKSRHQSSNKKQNGATSADFGYDSDGSMLDLRENLKPIGNYIKDRERMLDEMLRCIKGAKLQSMLPDILKVI